MRLTADVRRREAGPVRRRAVGWKTRFRPARALDEDDSAATRADVGEEALKAVAMMDVNASLGRAALDPRRRIEPIPAKETARGS